MKNLLEYIKIGVMANVIEYSYRDEEGYPIPAYIAFLLPTGEVLIEYPNDKEWCDYYLVSALHKAFFPKIWCESNIKQEKHLISMDVLSIAIDLTDENKLSEMKTSLGLPKQSRTT